MSIDMEEELEFILFASIYVLLQNLTNPIRPTNPMKEDRIYLDPLRFGEDLVVFG